MHRTTTHLPNFQQLHLRGVGEGPAVVPSPIGWVATSGVLSLGLESLGITLVANPMMRALSFMLNTLDVKSGRPLTSSPGLSSCRISGQFGLHVMVMNKLGFPNFLTKAMESWYSWFMWGGATNKSGWKDHHAPKVGVVSLVLLHSIYHSFILVSTQGGLVEVHPPQPLPLNLGVLVNHLLLI